MVSYQQYYLEEGLKEKIKSMVLGAMIASAPLAAKINPTELYNQIATHEGVKASVYRDSVGKRTIGVGFNLEDNDNRRILQKHGINLKDILRGKQLTPQQIKVLYNESLLKAFKDVKTFAPNFNELPDNVQLVLIDMSYNLGLPKLLQFTKFREAIKNKNFIQAAKEMENSQWARQVGKRATKLISMMKS